MRKIQQNSKEIFIKMPTGAGKRFIISQLIELLEPESNILIITNTKILEQ